MAEIKNNSGPAHWLEVSLDLNDELAEAVAEVISRFVSNGVVVECEMKYNDAEDRGTPTGSSRVYGYIPIDDQIEDVRQRLTEALWHLNLIEPIPDPAFREIFDEDWMSSWKKHYRPIPIGEKLLILPAWVEQMDMSREAVRIDPSMAFGTGTHPSTQLCMLMVERYVKSDAPVIDVGCGSGILSIAAVKLGAKHVLAVDIDAASVKSTTENAEANQVLDYIETGKGSVQEILEGNFTIQKAKVVFANILAPIILRLVDIGLTDLVEEGGFLILSGILDEQAENIREVVEKRGFEFVEKQMIADWVVMVLKRVA
ncbi:MAG: 50S ribosomal protein L11 methyltransferase [Anaerolineaceae bacterium]|nr:50S ribosomal protein L11 methyltransferase [Anaerolineaceae bacterium]